MSGQSFDLAVIGGGPGGYVAAIRASQLGQKVVVVEREHLSGICLNWGCIPTKALLASADVLRMVKNAKRFGIDAGPPQVDLAAVVRRSREVADQLSGGVRHLLKNAVALATGVGRLAGAGVVSVQADGESSRIEASHIIFATGARARQLPGVEISDDIIVTYKGALRPTTIPGELLVVGSGAIGTEFASFHAALGSKVTIAEAVDRLVPGEDADISAFLERSLRKDGLEVLTSAKEAIVCVERIAGLARRGLDRTRIPACTYSHPQIGSIGLTERAARANGLQITVGLFPYAGNGKAVAVGEPDGLTKVIYDKTTGELLGAHIIGAEATELISTFSIGKTLETTFTEMTETIFPHPTISESLHEASLAALGRAIHY